MPLDKWRRENFAAYADFITTIGQFPNHFKLHIVDEKHIVNKDCIGDRVRADPLTGVVRCIAVSGNFRQAYNLIAIISANPQKTQPVEFTLGEENGTAAAFSSFIEQLLVQG